MTQDTIPFFDDAKELAQHTPRWIPVPDARDFLNIEAQQYIWDIAAGKMR